MPVPQAMEAARKAVEFDKANQFDKAIPLYLQAADIIDKSTPSQDDSNAAAQYRKRATDLQAKVKASGGGSGAAVDQAALAMQGMQVAGQAQEAVQKAGSMETMAAAGAVGGAAGLMFVGPMAAVAAAGAAVYCTTRSDTVGEVARSTGEMAVAGASAAKKFNDDHNITGNIAEAGKAAATKAKEIDQKYKIAEQVSTGITSATAKAKEFNEKHDVTGKVGGAISSGLASFTKAVKPSDSGSSSLPSVPK